MISCSTSSNNCLISIAPEKCKKACRCLNYSGTRFLSDSKLKILNFLMDSALIYCTLNSNDRTSISIQKWFQLWEKDSHPSIYCSNIICTRINTFIQIASYLIQLLLSLFLTQYSPIFSTNCHLFKVNSNT